VEIRPADATQLDDLVRLVNEAYDMGERGLWVEGAARTDAATVAGAIGELLVAVDAGRVVGCVRVQPIDAATADLGLVAVAPDRWGTGLGRDGVHPDKARLRAWYERLGYAVVRTAPLADFAPGAPAYLATPCEVLVFQRSIG
jgi:N-acetylglutamate synthase-like GNAT family acetyltransferase